MVLLSQVLALSVMLAPGAEPVTLARVYKKGDKQSYRVRGNLQVEAGSKELKTPIPEETELTYEFSTEVTQMKTDGIAVLHYKRPTFTILEGEDEQTGLPIKTVEKVNMDLELTVSPINDILNVKDLTPKKKPTTKKANWMSPSATKRQDIIGDFLGEIYRLMLFVGSFDSAMDFAPKLPLDPVNVGDTWKQTVGYQPQKLKGSGKQAVQRLDLTLTYKGLMKVGKQNVHRVQAKVALDTDLAEFIHQTYQVNASETGLSKVIMKLNTTIDYDLDVKNFRTLGALAISDGSLQVFLEDDPTEPEVTETMKGRTILKSIPTPAPAPVKKKKA